MYFIETISPEEATECVEVLYNHLQGARDYLPNYARVFCHRPTLMAQIATLMDALRGHMDPRLWSLVNLAAARASNSSYCSLVFAHKLINRGMSQEQLLQVLQGVQRLPGGRTGTTPPGFQRCSGVRHNRCSRLALLLCPGARCPGQPGRPATGATGRSFTGTTASRSCSRG